MTALTDRVLELLPNARLHKADSESEDVVIWGPPGTGKSTSLQTLLDAHLRAGHEPSSLLVNAFTRNATAELRRRLAAQGYELPWLRTIHSSCFALLGLRSQQVVQRRELEAFGQDEGYELKGVLGRRSLEDPYGGVSVATVGDWCYVAEELRRQRRQTLQGAVATLQPPPVAANWDLEQATAFSTAYAAWKRSYGLYDFADMLELVLSNQIRPPVTTLFVDEAQDNTALVWAVVDLWRERAERTFTMADDDQSIFQFAGADPAALWRRPGSQFVLSHSYRLPSAVHRQAQAIIRRTRDRVVKAFTPDREGGEVGRAWDWTGLDLSREGTWLLLARNRAFLEEARQTLTRAGVGFRDRTSDAGVPDPDSALGRAVDAALRLHAGEVLPKMRLRHLRQSVRDQPRDWAWDGIRGSGALADLAEMGATARLVRTLQERPLQALQLEPAVRDYLEAVVSRDGRLSAPRVELATIHGVKGEEGTHVAVSTAMTRQTYDGYQEDPDAENRVFYVAATRAKETLTWVVNGGRGYAI